MKTMGKKVINSLPVILELILKFQMKKVKIEYKKDNIHHVIFCMLTMESIPSYEENYTLRKKSFLEFEKHLLQSEKHFSANQI